METKDIKNIINTLISVIVIIILYFVSNRIKLTYMLALIIDRLRFSLGLIPLEVQSKLGLVPYSVLTANVIIFAFINLITGAFLFKIIKKRGTQFSGTGYAVIMLFFFSIIAVFYSLLSQDPGGYPFAVIGSFIIGIIQIPIASYILGRKQCS